MQLSKKQTEFWLNANRRWNIKQGATRSGKTYMDYYVIPRRIRKVKGTGLIVLLGNTKGTLKRNIWDPLRKIYGSNLVGNVSSDNTVKLFGQTAYMLGADKANQVSKIQGSGIEYCYGDEVTTWNEEVFQMLKSRLSEPTSIFDGTCNPDNPNHWLRKFLSSGADIYQQSYTIDDNPFLTPDFVTNLKREYAGTVFYDRFILGKWCLAEGVIYDMFGDKNITDVVHEGFVPGKAYVSIDYGTQNATVFLMWRKGMNSGRWYCVDEYYYSGRSSLEQKTDDEYACDLIDFVKSNGLKIKELDVIVDPAAASFIVCLRKKGFRVTRGKNDVIDGIRYTGGLLSSEQLIFTTRCVETIKEFGAYTWDPKAVSRGEDKPLKENDHCMDAVRYFAYTILNKNCNLNTNLTGGI